MDRFLICIFATLGLAFVALGIVGVFQRRTLRRLTEQRIQLRDELIAALERKSAAQDELIAALRRQIDALDNLAAERAKLISTQNEVLALFDAKAQKPGEQKA